MDSHSYWLKKERLILGVLIGIETFLAMTVLLIEIWMRYWGTLDWETQKGLMFGTTSGLGRMFRNLFSSLTSEPGQEFVTFMIYAPVCLLLFAAMWLCLRSNHKNPIMSRWGMRVLFIGIILPILICFFYQIWAYPVSGSSRFRPEIENIWRWWLYLGILPTQFFLFRDLHRYTKAIHAQLERDKQAEKIGSV